MCGKSDAKIDGKEVKVFIGNYGGALLVDGNPLYARPAKNNGYIATEAMPVGKECTRSFLVNLGAEKLADMILQFVENGDEE